MNNNFKCNIVMFLNRDKDDSKFVLIEFKEKGRRSVCCADSVSVSFNEEGTMPFLWPVSVTCSRILAPWEHEGKTLASETARCQKDWKRDVTRTRAFRPTSVVMRLRNAWTYDEKNYVVWNVKNVVDTTIMIKVCYYACW